MKEGSVQQVGNAPALYFHPKNRFVAKFIGNLNINIFNIKDLDDFGNNSSLEKYVGIRPENVLVSDSSDDKYGISVIGELIDKQPKFPFTSYLFNTKLGEVSALSHDGDLEIGKNYNLYFPEKFFVDLES